MSEDDPKVINVEFPAFSEPEWRALIDELLPLLIKAKVETLRAVLKVLKEQT